MSEEIARLLVDVGAVEIRTDPDEWFTWTSGKRAPIYCDNRILMGYPEARARVADVLVERVRADYPDATVVAGTATAGIPHAAWAAERLGLPMVYVRGSAKGHGKQKCVEGVPPAGESVVLIEDMISTGGSAADAVGALREEGANVRGVLAIVSYGFPAARERFEALGAEVQALVTYDQLVGLLGLDAAKTRVLLDWRGS